MRVFLFPSISLAFAVLAAARGCDVDMRPISDRMRDSTAVQAAPRGERRNEVIADGVRWRVEDGRLAGEPVDGAAATPERPGPLTAADALWTPVREWRGTGSHVTESFAVRTPIWRVVADGTLTRGTTGFLRTSAFDAGGERLAHAVREGAGSDTLYVRGGPGVFHLDVAAGYVRWTARVEEMRLPAERIARP